MTNTLATNTSTAANSLHLHKAASSAFATSAAFSPLATSAALLFSASPDQLLTSAYLQQRKKYYTTQAWNALLTSLSISRTLYVGNLSFTTREEQLYELFSLYGPIQRVIMGLNHHTFTPCGFCFIEYYDRLSAAQAKYQLSGNRVDDRVVVADLDQAFVEGRQYGRSKSGGQIRDDHRQSFDRGRGGWGLAAKMKQQREAMMLNQQTTFAPMNSTEEEMQQQPQEEEQEYQPARPIVTYKAANEARHKSRQEAAQLTAAHSVTATDTADTAPVKRQRVTSPESELYQQQPSTAETDDEQSPSQSPAATKNANGDSDSTPVHGYGEAVVDEEDEKAEPGWTS